MSCQLLRNKIDVFECEERGHHAETVFDLGRLLWRLLVMKATNGPESWSACRASPTKNQKIRGLK